ncbi:MAG: DUF2029 domain-containing protein [Bacteroidetes bacterium]|nr:DUF2029 domain-containing protein [Bacteroidota bacterium]MBS1758038.1 DUF2029 domain-containing protein [Bacteroidota bacterium]
MQPISKLGFHTIEIIWFIVQYLFLLSIFGLFLWNIKELQYRYILLTVFSLFFFSKGWITNVDIGQSYILFPLLWSVAFFLKNKKVKAYFFAGALLAVCCWLRPVCILMVLPFLVSDKRASFLKGFIIIGCLCILQLLLFHQYENWQDFFHSSFQWGKYYNTLGPASSTDFGNGKWPSTIEGQSDFHITAIPQYTANLPIVASSLFNIHIKSLWYIVLFFILATTIIFSVYKKRTQLKLDTIWISSFVIYYLSEVFVSVPKPSYYFVELIFPICIMVGSKSIFKNRTGLALLLLGLCLSTFAIRLIPMQLLIGEYLVFISLLFFLSNQLKIKQQIINQ